MWKQSLRRETSDSSPKPTPAAPAQPPLPRPPYLRRCTGPREQRESTSPRATWAGDTAVARFRPGHVPDGRGGGLWGHWLAGDNNLSVAETFPGSGVRVMSGKQVTKREHGCPGASSPRCNGPELNGFHNSPSLSPLSLSLRCSLSHSLALPVSVSLSLSPSRSLSVYLSVSPSRPLPTSPPLSLSPRHILSVALPISQSSSLSLSSSHFLPLLSVSLAIALALSL